MKLLIGIPTSGAPTQPFLDALGKLRLPENVTSVERLVWSGNFVAAQREMLADAAVARGDDVLVMIDDDIVAPPDALERLLATLERDPDAGIAGGLYYSRDSARPMAVDGWRSDDTTLGGIPAFRAGAVARVAGVGFGCVAIRVAALRALGAPYFAAHVMIDRASRSVRQCDEDYLFCERLRRAGWFVMLDGGVRLQHYDRATQRSAPERWETDAETAHRRMIVRDGDAVRLVPFDEDVPRVRERQVPVPLVYLLADEAAD